MSVTSKTQRQVPFFRPSISEAEIREVVDCLRSGWLTTGPRTREFETSFAAQVGAQHAVATNSCTAALHLAVEALGLKAGQAVLVPTMTFAATAEAVLYQGAVPVLVDCDPVTLHLDLEDAQRKLEQAQRGEFGGEPLEVAGIIPVHVGGLMMDLAAIDSFAARHQLWVVEDAAHAFPAAQRKDADDAWRRCGQNTAAVTCFSFYANKTITTGEGGMAVTDDPKLHDRMRQMSLHGLSHDAWNRYRSNGSWDYQIVAPGYKYNLTDIAASIGLQQLQRAESMRAQREEIAAEYREALHEVTQFELPPDPPNRLHAWHLFPIRLALNELTIDRNAFLDALRDQGVACSVHWRPLHLHPYYADDRGWTSSQLPVATTVWETLISLPLFPGMIAAEREHVVQVLHDLSRRFARPSVGTTPKPR